ncbi:MAG: oligosaccharide flippase family protein [Akkermansiaceae bacterium]|nr:oligosaccharide flippase family protein [Armatimonadota bacterium]
MSDVPANKTAHPPARDMGMTRGTLLVFGAEALALPAALFLTALLTRHFGVDDYGRFTLLATLIAWVEWSLSSVWSRATIKLVSEADDWRPIGRAVARLSLGCGLAAAGVLALLAFPLSHMFSEPTIALPLLLFSLDIPLFCLAQAHRSLLVGTGRFSGRAATTAARALFRSALIAVLVSQGAGIMGAILGSIGASVAELAVARLFIRPDFRGTREESNVAAVPPRLLWEAAGPLLVYAISLRLFDKLDLFLLKSLGGTAREAGLYGAAQNLAILPGIFAMAFVPALLATVGNARRQERDSGEEHGARKIGRGALRVIVRLLPFGALVAGCASGIVSLFFGPAFAGTAPLIGPLFFAALAQCIFAVATVLLTAGDRIWWTAVLASALLAVAFGAHFLIIPRYGSLGAASVTLVVSVVGAIAALTAVYDRWKITPPVGTVVRTLLVTAGVYALATRLPQSDVSGPLAVAGRAFILMLAIVLGYTLLGEWDVDDTARAKSFLQRFRKSTR